MLLNIDIEPINRELNPPEFDARLGALFDNKKDEMIRKANNNKTLIIKEIIDMMQRNIPTDHYGQPADSTQKMELLQGLNAEIGKRFGGKHVGFLQRE